MTKLDRPHPNVIFTRLDNTSAALLNLENKLYYTLNETGAVLWRRLECGDDREAMVRALCEGFDVSLEGAREAVDEFVEELRREGLLSR